MILLDRAGRWFARWPPRPRASDWQVSTTWPENLARTLRPGDILLVEGSSRISSAIKYLTQSSWSHAAICVAPPDLVGGTDPHILLEADVSEGVRLMPLSRYASQHSRICRPVGLSEAEIGKVIQLVVSRVGQRYDLKHIWDLARYLVPHPPCRGAGGVGSWHSAAAIPRAPSAHRSSPRRITRSATRSCRTSGS